MKTFVYPKTCKVYKELERIIRGRGKPLSVGKVLDAANNHNHQSTAARKWRILHQDPIPNR